MQKISKIKKNIFGNSSTNKAASAAFVCSRSLKVLKNIFPKEFVSEIEIISFKLGILSVGVKNSFYAQEIKLREGDILTGLRESFPELELNRIVCKTAKDSFGTKQ